MAIFEDLKRAVENIAVQATALPGTPPNGDFFAGMDTAGYPGDNVMQSIIETTNLKWTGFYLTPAPSQGHNLKWMSRADFLRSLGWGIAPIYVGRQIKAVPNTDHRITPENGKIDGEHAAKLASSAGLAGSTIYLDYENGAPLRPEQKTYYAAWADALVKKGFSPGLYCVASIAPGLMTVVPGAPVWVANYSKFPKQLYKPPFPQPDPDIGASGATMWQLRGNINIEYTDVGGKKKHAFVDLNSSTVQDPSAA
jgi:hypothetical protein